MTGRAGRGRLAACGRRTDPHPPRQPSDPARTRRVGRAVAVARLGRRLRFGLTGLGERELEGVPAPVTVFDIRYQTPPGGAGRERLSTVGREAELRRVRGWWEEALAGRGGFGLVGGEPGI